MQKLEVHLIRRSASYWSASSTVPAFNSCTKYQGIIHDRTPACHQCHGHGCTDSLTTERDFDSQASLAIDVFGLYFEIVSTGDCTTRHWQTTGRVVQELNVCTVLMNYNQVLPGVTPSYQAYDLCSSPIN